MNKYIFINQVTGPLFIDILNVFSRKGEDVALYTGEVEKASKELHENVKVSYFTKYRRNNAVLRILTWLLFPFLTFIKLLLLKKDYKLFLVTNSPFTPFLGSIFYKMFKIKFYVLVYDIYPDALVNFNYISKESFIYKIWARINKRVFTEAEKVFTISDCMADIIKSYYNKHDNLRVIHNWVDTDFIKPIKKEDNWFAKKYNQVDKLTVIYSGNMGATHDLESLIEAAKILKNESGINFLIIGDGVKKEKIEKMVIEYELNNVILLPFQPAEVIPFSMACGDIGVVTLGTGAEGLSVPSKTYYMMAAGNAILAIASKDSELAKICNKYQIGKVIESGNSEQISKFLLSDTTVFENFSNISRKISQNFTPKLAEEYFESL
ncbi:MAG: glycosyltransferase family 4 protein [Melioribacteraceae bacterium]|nr:glycosyltransferase family 4 protein [Melioribacteraceae bacterium]